MVVVDTCRPVANFNYTAKKSPNFIGPLLFVFLVYGQFEKSETSLNKADVDLFFDSDSNFSFLNLFLTARHVIV